MEGRRRRRRNICGCGVGHRDAAAAHWAGIAQRQPRDDAVGVVQVTTGEQARGRRGQEGVGADGADQRAVGDGDGGQGGDGLRRRRL